MPDNHQPTRAESEASEWLVLLDSPVVPQNEIERFQSWLGASEENKRAWAEVSQTWDKLGPTLASLPPEVLNPAAANDDAGGRGVALGRLPAWAAPAAIAAGLAGLALFTPLPSTAPSDEGAVSYATAAGDMRTLALEDGSTVELSPLAEASVAFSAAERRVTLDRGAALFEVARDRERPFIVATRFGEVRVLGTAFAVRLGSDGADVSVVRGVVEGVPQRGASLWARIAHASAPVTARAQQEIRLGGGDAVLAELAPAQIEQRLAWRQRMVAGENMTLGDAALEVTRFSGVAFEFRDDQLARERVTLFLDGTDVGGFIALLEANLGVRSERVSGQRVVLSRES